MTLDQEFIELNEKLRVAARAYYTDDAPVMSDAEYDRLVQRSQELEALVSKEVLDSETEKSLVSLVILGNVAKGLSEAKHSVPMISLRTEVDTSDKPIVDFLKRVEDKLGIGEYLFIAETKFDGLALSLKYENGDLVAAATRGDGYTGEDVLHNVKVMNGVVQKLPEGSFKTLEVRGEVLMPKHVFADLNKARAEKGLKLYVNPRNAAAGSLRLLDPKESATRGLKFIAYQAFGKDIDGVLPLQGDVLDVLRQLGFETSPGWKSEYGVEQLYKAYKSFEQERPTLAYEIDGVVYKLDNLDLQKKMGVTGKEPNWAIAHKFEPEEVTTTIRHIDVQVGRTGSITPVARVDTVFVGGTNVSNVTLNNIFDIRRKDVRIGDKVFIRRAGDVIPEITTRVPGVRAKYVPNFKMPTQCPVCGGLVLRKKGEAKYKCTNTLVCSAQLKGSLLHYCSRSCMDIHGFGEKTIDALVDGGVVTSIADIYTLSVDKLAKVEITGKTAKNLLDAVDGSRVNSLARFVYGLGIRHLGEQASKDLAKRFGSIEAIIAARLDELTTVPDIGLKTGVAILMTTTNRISVDIIRSAIKTGKLLLAVDKVEVVEGPLKGQTFVVSGKLTHYETVAPDKTREYFLSALERLGATVSDKVNKDTTALIIGEKPSSKLAKAKAMNIRVMSDKEAMQELLGLVVE